MRDYTARHFEDTPASSGPRVARRLESVRRAVATHIAAGRAALHARAAGIELSLAFDETAGRRFFRRLGRRLEHFLSLPEATLRLSIDALTPVDARALDGLLARVARHGDRIVIVVHERLHGWVRIDSSRFRLALPAPR